MWPATAWDSRVDGGDMLVQGLGGEELASADMAVNGAAAGDKVVLRMSRGRNRVHGDGMLA